VTVIAFPRAERHHERLRGIEQCLDALYEEAEELGLDLLAHMIAVSREAARETLESEGQA
jgi:hypothetical protein